MEKGYYCLTVCMPHGEVFLSQSTIKMEKGYYVKTLNRSSRLASVAIHNKNGKGLLHIYIQVHLIQVYILSQSTIKMEKGYYYFKNKGAEDTVIVSQSTIKMEKGYYLKPKKKITK